MSIVKSIVGFLCFIAVCLGIVFFVLYPNIFWLVAGTWIAAAALFATWLILNRKHVFLFLTKKSTRYGANFALVNILILGILVFINILGKEYNWKKDITAKGVNTLSAQTMKLLKDLKDPVKVTYFTRLQDREKAETVLKMYKYQSSKFKFEIVDPNKNPTLTKSLGVAKFDTAVVAVDRDGGKKITVEGISEEKLTNGLVRLLKTQSQTIYFTVGHGEHALQENGTQEAYSTIRKEIEKDSYTVKELNLFADGKIPPDASALIIAGPRTAFFAKEIDIIGDWVKNGGKAIFLFELDVVGGSLYPGSKQVADLLGNFGVGVNDKILIDPTSRAANVEPQVLMAMSASRDHIIVKDFPTSGMGLVPNFLFPLTTNFKKSDTLPKDVAVTPLARTTANAWAESDWASLRKGIVRFDEGKDAKGEMDLAYAIEMKPKNTRVVLFASSSLVMNAYLGFLNNKDLFLNSLAWVTSNDDFISIRAKSDEAGDHLQLNQNWMNFVFLIVVFVMPVSILGMGVWVWYGRRGK